MRYVKNSDKTITKAFKAISASAASCIFIATYGLSAPGFSFDALETRIQLSSSEKLPLVEHEVARLVQEKPMSAEAQYAMSSLLLRMFLHEPTNTDLLRQSADLAAQAYELDSNSDLGIVALASILDVTGETTKGLALLNEAQKRNINLSWRYHLAKAKLLSAEENSLETLNELNAALMATGANREIIGPYVVFFLTGNYQGDKLRSELVKWESRFPCDDLKLALATVQSSSGNLKEALANYRAVIHSNPNKAEARLGEGLALLNKGNDYRAAAAALRKAVQLDLTKSLKSTATLGLAVAQIRLKTAKDSIAEATSAVASAENQEAATIIITNEYKSQKRYDEAVKFLDALGEIAPGLAINHALRGEILISSFKKNSDAIYAFSDAIVLDNSKSAYYNGRGLAFSGLRQAGRALIDFESAARIDPTDGSARYNMACALALLGRKNEALEALASALDLDERLYQEALVDNDFKSIRSTEEFQIITDKLKSTPVIAH